MLKLLSLLRAMCVWTLLLTSQLASAHSPVHPETRVGDFEVAAGACVRLSVLATSSGHQEKLAASTAEAVGYPHATKGVPRSLGAAAKGEGILNWAWNSTKTFGHTFKTHGAGAKLTKSLTGRAAGTGTPQGQWLNNEAAAQFLRGQAPYVQGPVSVPIPAGLGQVIMPNGSVVQATRATLIPGANGGFRSAFPIF